MEQAERPTVLISHPMLSRLETLVPAEGWTPLRRWEMRPDQHVEVRAILHAGEVPLEPEFLESLPNLGLIAVVSVGYDGVDVPWCRARGVEVTHAAGLNADDVADHALGLMLASWRDLAASDRMVREGAWTMPPKLPLRPSLRGRRLGVVGLGRIGAAAATRAESFGLEIAWWGPRDKPAPWPRAESLADLAAAADILLIACRADASNRGLVSREILEALGPEGLLVNVARGSVVDEDALIGALKDGRLGRAALDVFAEEPTPHARWTDVPNVLLTPHTASRTLETAPRMSEQALENIRRFLAGQTLLSPIAA
jgi:lactate dehydrogenase-like 2-hydroxyacid dehydrogenase